MVLGPSLSRALSCWIEWEEDKREMKSVPTSVRMPTRPTET